MPWLVETIFGSEYSGAVDAARIILVAAAIQFALGWSKSLPVTIGRPRLRIVTHGLEALVVIPLVAVLGSEWGATGAAVAVLVATVVFAARLGGGHRAPAGRCRGARTRGRRGRAVKVLIVSGIWPPDVGGPASHAPELAGFLLARGHSVEVVTTADAQPAKQPYEVRWVDRAAPAGVRHARVAAWIRERATHADVVYATSMLGRAVARRVARAPAGRGQARRGRGLRARAALRAVRRRPRRRSSASAAGFAFGRCDRRAIARFAASTHLVCPSGYLAALAVSWGVPRERVTVLPNAAPALPSLPDRDEARAALGVEGPLLAFAGRITKQKALEVALDALGRVDGVTLAIAGDGPDLPEVSSRRVAELGLDGRVRFLGPLDRDDVLTLFRAADASLLTSSWENFPHTVVEALAVGTPVIATAVGGVPELVRDGENGLLVPAGDGDALAAAIRRLLDEPGLRERLAAAAAPSVEHLRPETLYARLEAILRRGRAMSGDGRPRVLFVGRGRIRFPLGRGLERRFEALSGELDWRQLGTAVDGKPSPDPRLVLARPFPLATARRAAVLRAASSADRARAPPLPAGRGHRAGGAGDGARAARATAGEIGRRP